ncbi:hypothetical protein SAMN00790413_04590 [Deinococcus hopiensis KR-140]|uniref:DUF2946 domain-containing protein n=1 Tax=Deinococcus hopiensis KR-140 TaxID=695939 RepID=A0A1W1UL46_9DEIO|nr:hypothetical protein SAMN00790413_04590 [Deinococcus hopiensis KR-140]
MGAGQRWLLAFLCLLASLAYLTRAPEAPGLFPPSAFLGASLKSVTAKTQQVRAELPASTLPAVAGMDMSGRVHHPAPAAPELTNAAPNAPPAGHDQQHAAHCPFCFTSAFALEAAGVSLALPGSLRSPWLALKLAPLHLAQVRHADPRAPPQG